MLGRLLKYEFRDMAKKMIPLYGVAAALAVILVVLDRFGTWKAGSTMMGIMATLFIISLTVMMTVTIVAVVQRFSHSLLGDEAYFTLTLPVTKGRHIWAKTISGSVWMTISTIVCVLVVAVIAMANIEGVSSDITQIDMKSTAQVLLLIAEFALLVLVLYARLALKLYASMAAGSLTQHFGAASCGVFIAFTVIEAVIAQLIAAGGFTVNYTITSHVVDFGEAAAMIGAACAMTAAGAAVYYLVTWLLMEKKVELR
jgi:hypothetical protein